jgi:protein TonB
VKQELVGSALAHVLLALFLIFITAPGTLPPPVLSDQVMLVTPVDALPAGLFAPPETAVPAAQADESISDAVAIPSAQPEAITIKPKETRPKVKAKETPKQPVNRQEPPAQAAVTETPSASPDTLKGTNSDVIESHVQAGAGSASSGSILGLPGGTPGGRSATYPDRVTNKVYYMWKNPVKTPDAVTCSVVFRIDADGRASQIALERTSGLPAFDNATLRAVYEAAPYPPFPRSMDQSYIVMRIIFEYLP